MGYINFQAKRKGVSLVECAILMIVLVVALGAVLQTMFWAQRHYVFNRQDRDSREVLFNWVQTFESLWPPEDMPIDAPAAWAVAADKLIKKVGENMGTWNDADKTARIDGFDVYAAPGAAGTGSMELQLLISSGRKTWVNLKRSYNVYTTDTVSDDSLQKGA